MQTIELKLRGKRLIPGSDDGQPIIAVGDNNDYYIHFDIDEPRRAMFALFSRETPFCEKQKQESVLIDENRSVNVPLWVLKSRGFNVGVISDGFASTPLYVYVDGSIIDKDGIETESPAPGIAEQLIKLVNDLQMKGIDEGEMKRLIGEYISEHPIDTAGNGVESAAVNVDGELVLALADGTQINCGKQGLTSDQVKALIDNAIGHIARFDGDYEVTPKTTPQILGTKDKLMTDDVEIRGIPTYEVSNQSGTTLYIGKEI